MIATMMTTIIAVLRDRLFVVFVYVYMYYMLVRLSVCLNHSKGTIIIIINSSSSSSSSSSSMIVVVAAVVQRW